MDATRKLLGVLAVLCQLVAMTSSASAEDIPGERASELKDSCAYVEPGHGIPRNIADAAKVGQCVAVVATVLGMQPLLDPKDRFCADKLTQPEAMHVLILYMNDHPEKLHLQLWEVALMAFRFVWPCQ